MIALNTVDAENKERNREKEAENDANKLRGLQLSDPFGDKSRSKYI